MAEDLIQLIPLAKDYIFPEAQSIQTDIINAYRISDAFRWNYGYEVLRRFPNGKMARGAIKAIYDSLGEEATASTHRDLMADMIYTNAVLGFYFWEYFAYGLQKLSPTERIEFLSERARLEYYKKLNPKRESNIIFEDKYESYKTFQPYYKREMIKVSSEDSAVLSDFCKSTERFIVKPAFGSLGKGIQIINVSDYSSTEELFSKLVGEYISEDSEKKQYFVCEELIENAESLSVIHPSSVNSFRVFTYYDGKNAHVFTAWIKAGKGGAIVDNGGAGGMVAAVDVETGTVISDAGDEKGNTYACHPDSGIHFKGMVIDRWDELLSMVNELAAIIPDTRIVGWDIALSKDHGWQLIEANSHGMMNVLQVATRKGMRKEFEKSIEWKSYKQ